MTMPEMPRLKVEWRVTIGSLFNAILIVGGFLWAVSTFAAKTQADNLNDKDLAAALKLRVEYLDTRTAAQDSRIARVETGIVYIQESLKRIEANTRRP